MGREAILERLRWALEAARAGRGGLCLLQGDRGIGKSSTLRQFALRAAGEGVLVLGARCHGDPHAPPLGPWVQILLQLQRARAGVEGSVAQASWPAEVAYFLQLAAGAEAPRPEPPRLEPHASRLRLLAGFSAVLQQIPSGQTRVVWLDNLDASDPLSSQLLAHLATALGSERLLVVATLRGHEIPEAVRPLFRRSARVAAAETIALAGLTVEEIDEYVARVTGRKPPAPLVEWLQVKTRGNPFLLEECLALLLRQGRSLDDRALLETPLPSSLAAAIQLRLQGLDPECLDLLSVASVIGRRFSLSLLGRAAAQEAEPLAAALGRAAAQGIVARDGSDADAGSFEHELVRDTLYDGMPSSRRAKLHAAVALALEPKAVVRGGPWADLAHHYHHSLNPQHSAQAEHYACRAATHASGQHAYEQAALFVQMALDARNWHGQRQPDARTGELLLALERAEFAARRYDRGEQAFQRLRAVSDGLGTPELAAEGVLAALSSAASLAAPRIALALPEILADLPPARKALRARLLSRLASCPVHALEPQLRARMAEQAEQLARESADRTALRAAARAGAQVLQGPDHVFQLLQRTDAWLSQAQAQRDPRLLADVRGLRYVAVLTLGDAAALGRELDALDQLANELCDPIRRWHVGRWALERDLWSGRWEGARERLAAQRGEGRRLFGPMAEFHHAVALFQWARLRGANTPYRAADSERLERDARRAGPGFHSAFALFLARSGRFVEARLRLQALAHADFEDLRQKATLEPLIYLAELAALLDDKPRAERIYALLLPHARLNAVTALGWYMGSVAHHLGVLATALDMRGAAADHLEFASFMHEHMGATPFSSQTRQALAKL